MSVPAAKVKAICSSSEAALVRASRGPELAQLTPARVKQHAERARKLTTKWEGLVREQSRAHGRQTGVSGADANTQLKAEIFREALNAFEAKLKASEKAATSTAARAASTKRSRTAAHRTTRAAVRQDLKAEKLSRNLTAKKARSAAKKGSPPTKAAPKPAAKVESAPQPAGKPAVKSARPRAKAKAVRAVSAILATSKVAPAKQLRAKTAAKQARIAQSGKVTRAVGHTLARGQRAQARRDAKG